MRVGEEGGGVGGVCWNILLKYNVVLVVISINKIDSNIVVIRGIFFFWDWGLFDNLLLL